VRNPRHARWVSRSGGCGPSPPPGRTDGRATDRGVRGW